MVATTILTIAPAVCGWILDLIFGDPERLPHPVVAFGKIIAAGERRLNRGRHRRLKGALLALTLVVTTWVTTWAVMRACSSVYMLWFSISTILVFYSLAGTTLVREVRMVFEAADRSLEEGRRQVARIVGRATSQLSDAEVRTAALETLAENLNDGVVAPLFWFAIGGLPAMVAYKMINTLDSMIGYRTERYRRFGTFAARLDDVAGWLPARITALLMVVASGRPGLLKFVARYGRCHASPNSGYPEAALAGTLNCRFGGPHIYFGELIDKPYIGSNNRPLTTADMKRSVKICRIAEAMAMAVAMVTVMLTHIPRYIY